MSPAEVPIGVVTAFFGAPVLRDHPAHEPGLHVTAIALDDVSVALGGRRVVDDVVRDGRRRRVGDADRAERRRQEHAAARDRAASCAFEGSIELGGRAASRDSAGATSRAASRFVPQSPLLPPEMRVARVRAARPHAAHRAASLREPARPRGGGARARPPRPACVRRPAAAHALGRRAAARRARARARAGGAGAAARRADDRARHRPPAAGARPRRDAARRRAS